MPYILLAAIFIAGDQIVKHLIRANMYLGQSIAVFGDTLKLTYIHNNGAAFGMLWGKNIILIVVPIVIMVAIFIFIFKTKSKYKLMNTGLTLIAAGGVGNCIDRIIFGKVTDMISLSFFPPIFNVADIAVTFGCIFVIIAVIFSGVKKDKTL